MRFDRDELINHKIGKDDDADVNKTIRDEKRGEQRLGLIQQGDDAPRSGMLFGLQHIDILVGQ